MNYFQKVVMDEAKNNNQNRMAASSGISNPAGLGGAGEGVRHGLRPCPQGIQSSRLGVSGPAHGSGAAQLASGAGCTERCRTCRHILDAVQGPRAPAL